MTAGRRKRARLWALRVLALLVSTLGTAELVLRLYYDEAEVNGNYWGHGAFEGSDSTGYRHAAGYSGRSVRHGSFDCEVRIGEEGLRQHDLDTQLAHPRRLLLLGDSFTFGLGIEEEKTFAALLGDSLNVEGVGVINAGQTGFGVEQERRLALELEETLEPSAVVLCLFLGNDFENDHFPSNHENVEVVHGYRLQRDRLAAGSILDLLRTRSFLWMRLAHLASHGRILERRQGFRLLARRKPGEAAQRTLAALLDLASHYREAGLPFGVMLIPSTEQWHRELDALVTRTLEEEGIPLLDLRGGSFGWRSRFQGDIHWNARGHRRAADRLLPFVQGLLEGP